MLKPGLWVQVESVKLLLEWGADPHIKDTDGCSAMMYAKGNNLTYMLGLVQVWPLYAQLCTICVA